VKKVTSLTRALVYQVDYPCYEIGGGVRPIGIKVKRILHEVYLKGNKWCIPIFGTIHQKYKIQASAIYPNASLCINEKYIFMKIDDKGGEIVQRYKSFGGQMNKDIKDMGKK
jgi:hypothetical protein